MFVESFNSKGIKKLAFIYSENFHVCFLWLSSLPFQSKSRIKHKCSTFEALRQCRECERDFFLLISKLISRTHATLSSISWQTTSSVMRRMRISSIIRATAFDETYLRHRFVSSFNYLLEIGDSRKSIKIV